MPIFTLTPHTPLPLAPLPSSFTLIVVKRKNRNAVDVVLFVVA